MPQLYKLDISQYNFNRETNELPNVSDIRRVHWRN